MVPFCPFGLPEVDVSEAGISVDGGEGGLIEGGGGGAVRFKYPPAASIWTKVKPSKKENLSSTLCAAVLSAAFQNKLM